ncbi:DUF4243 domain-containing protein [Streptomyces roseirectus]|uniref:DUF4243 domain-containing protein n=1 Tax=Streptomyces roseirectus TaxID=2768066 RepID=A0A7H0I7G9_9ACTN|nr:questin oxidase family protein [Streptomyces roseirectus]QNP68735.1 DUF4243 domain-containing protein [Streptomyces roseirectus]
MDDTTGILDEALRRLHVSGPERLGRLTNHAPMAVEALAARGRAKAVHRWLDLYASRLEDFPAAVEPVTADNWRTALGDPRRAADWITYFDHELTARPWRDVLAEWWPRLLPGLYGGSTHPVIRVGHAVRTLLAGEADAGARTRMEASSGTGADASARPGVAPDPAGVTTPPPVPTPPRLTELAHGLGYWAARHHTLPVLRPLSGAGSAAAALEAVRPIADQDGGFPVLLARVEALPVWAAGVTEPEEAYRRLTELVRAATHRYATHGHGEETMLVHAATAPNGVLRALPALPRALWAPSLHAAWSASAAVTAMYSPAEAVAWTPTGLTPEEVVERAAAHGDEHVIKLTDTALDVGDEQALAAAVRAIELSEPLT